MKFPSTKQIAKLYGFKTHRGRIQCPFHKGEDYNLSLYEDGFKCWVCGVSGNTVAFVAGVSGITYREAAESLENKFQLPKGAPKIDHSTKYLREWKKHHSLKLAKLFHWLDKVPTILGYHELPEVEYWADRFLVRSTEEIRELWKEKEHIYNLYHRIDLRINNY